jgi:hypothetical protein
MSPFQELIPYSTGARGGLFSGGSQCCRDVFGSDRCPFPRLDQHVIRVVMGQNLARFPWEELQAENVHFLFRVVDEYIVGVPERGKKVSVAALACFGKAPDILGVNRFV